MLRNLRLSLFSCFFLAIPAYGAASSECLDLDPYLHLIEPGEWDLWGEDGEWKGETEGETELKTKILKEKLSRLNAQIEDFAQNHFDTCIDPRVFIKERKHIRHKSKKRRQNFFSSTPYFQDRDSLLYQMNKFRSELNSLEDDFLALRIPMNDYVSKVINQKFEQIEEMISNCVDIYIRIY